jgi:uroporphyrinogen-III decarboxylase
VDAPDVMKRLLGLVTETYVACMKAWQDVVPSQNSGGGGHAVHWSLMHRGRIMLRDDSAMNLSPAMFDEFVAPYDGRLLREFATDEGEGGGIHFCGKGDHYISRAAAIEGLTTINMSQPDYNDMETIYASTVDRGIAIVGLARSTAEEALARGRDLRGLVHCW